MIENLTNKSNQAEVKKEGQFRKRALSFLVLLLVIAVSVGLFFLSQLNMVTAQMKASSITYSYIEPWGPWTISGLGKVIPAFNNVFDDLKEFFAQAGTKIKA